MKNILFVCTENSCRSQMAEGFAHAFRGQTVRAYSAGSKPSGIVNSSAIQVMREAGIDISEAQSKGFDAIQGISFDIVVTMGCGDRCPFIPGEKHIAWDIEDPKGKGIEVFRTVRDVIKVKVAELLSTIK